MPADWVRYWRAESAPVEAMHAHFAAHVYHRHSHESYSFGVTEAGAQAFTCRHARHVSSAGLVMAFNPDDPHDGHASDTGGFTYRMVHIWPEYFAAILHEPGCGDGRDAGPLPLFRDPVIADPALAASLLRLHAALTRTDPAGTDPAGTAPGLVRDERLAETARLLARHASARTGRGAGDAAIGRTATHAATRVIAERARDRIHDSLGCFDGGTPAPGPGLVLADLAAAAGCSRFAAYRAFSSVYGMTPSDYVRQVRLRTARRLLAAGILPADAAVASGFADQAHLTRWFRRYYGVTPGAYQAAARPGRAGLRRPLAR